MAGNKVLIVDDEVTIRKSLSAYLKRKDYNCTAVQSAAEALSVMKSNEYDLLITDIRMPDMDGLELIQIVRESKPNLPVIVITGYATVENAIQATKLGVYHYVTKPFDVEEVANLVAKSLDHDKLVAENKILKNQLNKKYSFDNIIGVSDEIKKIFNTIEKVADTDSTILITGESGTGKEVIARAIHYNSNRSDNLMVPINCGAIPGELLESELFGHVKGAFTGAVSSRQGRFELAHKGTMFLDEVGEMPLHLQVKLLRVLQTRKFEPVGSPKTIEVDTRIIAATNRDLEAEVNNKNFREDLFYRLNVIPIHIPALRERKADIKPLVEFFLSKFNENRKRSVEIKSEAVFNAFYSYTWPGNIRELENLIERLVILKGEGFIDVSDLPEKLFEKKYVSIREAIHAASFSEEAVNHSGIALDLPLPKTTNGSTEETTQELINQFQLPVEGIDLKQIINDFENNIIIQALKRTNGNKNKASELLKMNRTTLVEKLKKKNLLEIF